MNLTINKEEIYSYDTSIKSHRQLPEKDRKKELHHKLYNIISISFKQDIKMI